VNSAELGLHCEPASFHGSTNAMQHEPCALLGHAQSTVNLIARHAILAAHHEPKSGKPLLQWDGRVLKHSAYFQRKFLLWVSPVALVNAGVLQVGYFVGVAARAADSTIRPANKCH